MTLPLKIVWILCFKRDNSAESGLKARLVICGVLTLEWDLIQLTIFQSGFETD